MPCWTGRRAGSTWCAAASRLHIHRNSLIYRLDKISQRCGRSAREPEQGLALCLAALTEQLDGLTASARS
ncbi:helix-turn-helix domain-containing protein [Pseudonocardia sp.]|uniref:helix-turn-helix domain-containing protein n=1 Tax=Pseudonocardia sp. TaxID=60912 RepID=UPI0039C9E8B5